MNRDILRLAIPNIISNITVPLLGLIDLALMGHLGSEIYIGAISIGSLIFNFIYWGFGFLRMSTSGFAAQSLGKKDYTGSITLLVRALIISFLFSLLILILQRPIAWGSFLLIEGSTEVESLAREYFLIRVWAAPAALSLFVFSGWFLGMQNAKYPMAIAILSNITNIILSIFFVFGLNMKSNGVALGTALAQYAGLILAIFLFFKKYKKLLPYLNIHNIFEFKQLSSFFRVNRDIFIRSFCIIVVFTFFTSKSASHNNTILAVNSLLIQMLMFFSFFIDGFAFAGEALVGKFIGSNNKIQLNKVIKLLFKWGGFLALLFTLIYSAAMNPILHILTSQQEIINAAQPYIMWIIFIPIASFSSYIWDGIYIGATASKAMRNTLLWSSLLFFLPIYYFLHPIWGNHALWLAMFIFMLSRGLIQTIIFKKAIFNKQ